MPVKNKSKYEGRFTIGESFSRYTIHDDKIIIDNEAKVTCKCDCGNIRLVSCYTLIRGTSTQCLECGNSLKKDKNPAWKGYGNVSGKAISKLIRDAKLREIEFNLTLEYLDTLLKNQKMKCALTGIELTTDYKNLTASLDRISSDKGYIIGNVQWVHKDINMMKKHYDEEYFIKMCKLVANHN